MNTVEMIDIEVACGVAQRQEIIALSVPRGTSVSEAIELSGIAKLFPQLDFKHLEQLKVGIFAKRIDIHTYVLRAHDRIEIYRPLTHTPNQKRLARAKKHEE